MNIEVLYQHSETGDVFNISTLCTAINVDRFLDGQPGKLTCVIQEDPNKLLTLAEGSKITLKVDGAGVFYGYVFTMGVDENGAYKVTAYDQLRYLKNNDMMVTKNQTASDIFRTICTRSGLQHKVKFEADFICPAHQHPKGSRYNIIEYGITQTLINTKKKCFIRDEFGTLVFSELEAEKMMLVIGDGSLLTKYQYERSIDKDTYNEVNIYQKNEETGQVKTWRKPNSDDQKRWGLLSLWEEAKKEMNEAQITQLAENLIKLKSRPTTTLKLTILGVEGARALKAGDGFILSIDRLHMREYVWIQSMTHTFSKDVHTMQMEVFIV